MKPKGKGKLKQAEREHDEGLADAMTEKMKVKPKGEYVDQRTVGAESLRGVMRETMARVYGELWPGMKTHDEHGEVDIEIAEEAYILGLTMLVGSDDYKPRKGLRMKDADISNNAKYCEAHGA